MAVVAPALEMSADKPNVTAQTMAANAVKKKSLSIQVRSRSQSPDHEGAVLERLPEQTSAKQSAEGAQASTRKRRRA